MEKSMSGAVEPAQKPYGSQMLAVAAGLSLFWAPLFSMLVRNGFPEAEAADAAPVFQEGLLLRVAFFLGFAVAALAVSRLKDGRLSACGTWAAALVALFSLDTAAVGAASFAGLARPLAVNIAAWAVLGAGLSALLMLWVPLLARLQSRALASSLAVSTCAGAALNLMMNLLPGAGGVLFLAAAPLASLAMRMRLAADLALPERGAGEAARPKGPALPWRIEQPIPLAQSRANAHLSWAFGIVNVIYGVVFGLAAGTVTQWGHEAWLPYGVTALLFAGALCAQLFMNRSHGRISQSTVMRLLFPLLVIALAPQAFFSGLVPLACSLLVLGCYAFLTLVSIGFEIRGARERGAAPLFFVGMSQMAFAVGLAGGFALGMLPGLSGTFDHTMLAGIALVLVVVLAIIVATTQNPMSNAQKAADAAVEDAHAAAERAEAGRWRTGCAKVAEQAGLSNRETEVFMLLAKGRGTEHIQNKLGISSHTVKTHTYNIYHKMGIGSREELLDAVEAAQREEGEER